MLIAASRLFAFANSWRVYRFVFRWFLYLLLRSSTICFRDLISWNVIALIIASAMFWTEKSILDAWAIEILTALHALFTVQPRSCKLFLDLISLIYIILIIIMLIRLNLSSSFLRLLLLRFLYYPELEILFAFPTWTPIRSVITCASEFWCSTYHFQHDVKFHQPSASSFLVDYRKYLIPQIVRLIGCR